MAWSKVVAFWGLGSGLALIVARLIVGVHGTAATGVGFLGTLMVMAWGKGLFWSWSRRKGVGLQGQGVGGWDEWCEIGWCSWA